MPPVQLAGSRPLTLGGKTQEQVRSTSDQSRMATQTPGSGPRSRPQEAKSPIGSDSVPSAPYDSEDSDPNDSMVSEPTHSFVIQVTLKNLRTSVTLNHGALIDSGCTHCLMCRGIVNSLGLRTICLRTPIKFE